MIPNPTAATAGGTSAPSQSGHGFGTAPVFLASISTILGAILFLKFGYAVAHAGLWGSLMIVVLGLSGDLKNPQRRIPIGTIAATLTGMVVYALVAIKLAQSATPQALDADQFIMAQIAVWGPAIHIGLGAAAISSALGSILVAPRTLQALTRDKVLPIPKLNRLLAKGWGRAQEPVYTQPAFQVP